MNSKEGRYYRRLTPLLIVVVIATGCMGGAEEAETRVLRSETINRGNLQEVITVTGSINTEERVDLPFLQTGVVSQRFVDVGDTVRLGDPLLQLDTSQMELDMRDAELAVQLQKLAYEELRAGPSEYDVAAATAAVARAQAQLNQITEPPSEEAIRIAQANLDIARSNYWIALNERDAISQFNTGGQDRQSAELNIAANELSMNIALQDLTNAQQGLSSQEIGIAQATVYQAQATLDRLLAGADELDFKIAEIQIRLAEIALSQAQASLDRATLKAPFTGLVTAMNSEVGERVAPGLPVVTIVNPEQFVIDVFIDELDLPRIKQGQLAIIQFDAFPDEFIAAHVETVAPDAIDIQGISSYRVKLILEQTDLDLRTGMTASVEIIVAELTDVVLVPNWAVRFDRMTGEAHVITRSESGEISEIPVTIGTRGEDYSEVLEGLCEGNIVLQLQEQAFSLFRDQE